MKLNINQVTATSPSSFGMPACGHIAQTTFEGRVRVDESGAKADMGLAVAYAPGNTAWSPPSS